MLTNLIPLLRCPAGGGRLELAGAADETGWIETGELVCPANGRRYPIRDGMPLLYVDDERWQPKAREAVGWVEFHKDRGIYDQTGVEIDHMLPYFPEQPWLDIGKMFDVALDLVRPAPGKWVLDVGAGRGWAAKQLAVRGCNAVAIEINPDDQVGLGRSNALMRRTGVPYSAVIGDSENLPFADGAFDVVFSAAALHHTSDLDLLLRNIGRVLRPGGIMVAMNEPCVRDSATSAELERAVAEELSYGINENHPFLDDYRRALAGAGLGDADIFAWQAYKMPPEAMAEWSAQLGIEPPSAFAPPPPRQGWFARLLGRPAPAPAAPAGSVIPPRPWMDHMLRRVGGSIVILARKP